MIRIPKNRLDARTRELAELKSADPAAYAELCERIAWKPDASPAAIARHEIATELQAACLEVP